MIKIGKFRMSGKIVTRRLNHHMIKVLEPTRKISYEEAEEKVRKLLKE
jgi:hypothetical protein